MPVTGIDHYNLAAPREMLDVLRDFYCDVVGLTLGERPDFSKFGYWLYAGGKPILHLSEARTPRETPPDASFDHAAFKCDDFERTEQRLSAKGIDYRFARVPGTAKVQLFFSDPAGNGIELNFDSESA